MALYYAEGSKKYNSVLDILNMTFTAIYTIEAILKIVAFGNQKYKGWLSIPRYFISSAWNRFDFLLVVFSLIELGINNSSMTTSIMKTLPQIVRLLRVLRVARILRLVEKYEGLQALINTVIFSIPPLVSVFVLLLILLFVFAILGVYLFKDVVRGTIIDDKYMNFSNFGLSMLMLFRLTTGEDWSNVMTDTMDPQNCSKANPDCVSWTLSTIFFVGFNTICSYLMLNLFVMITLEQFDRYYLPRDNIMARFRRDLQAFQNAWALHADSIYQQASYARNSNETDSQIYLKDSKIIAFLRSLKAPLGF